MPTRTAWMEGNAMADIDVDQLGRVDYMVVGFPRTHVPASDLSPETVLQLAPASRTRLEATGHVLVDGRDDGIIDIGPRGFATLSIFASPLSL
jgi:hypothetical protein